MLKLAVICPVYNEAENIKLLVSEFVKLNDLLKKNILLNLSLLMMEALIKQKKLF